MFCADLLSYYWDRDENGFYTQKIRCARETMSTTKRNEWNPEYGNPDYAKDPEKPGSINQLSALILTPVVDDCLPAYTMYDGDFCSGNAKVSYVSYETSAQLQAAIEGFDDSDEDGTKAVRSVRIGPGA